MADAEFPREYLRRLVERRQIQQVGRGLYASLDFDPDEHFTLVTAAKRFPRGVVCLGSALRFHQIGTQSPHQLWLALERGSHPPQSFDVALRLCLMSEPCYSYGIEEHRVSGGTVRVYSPAKTVADCFKYRNKYGIDIAIEALREGWRAKRFSMVALTHAAKVCRVCRVMRPYLEMLT